MAKPYQFRRLSVSELLRLYCNTLTELRARGVTRSSNNPVSDYTEYLVADRLGLTLNGKSSSGYDAIDKRGRKYQIKGRRLTPENSSIELRALHNLDKEPFDYLIAVVYNPDFSVSYAGKVPYNVVVKLSKYSQHTNANRFLMRRSVQQHPGVADVTAALLPNTPLQPTAEKRGG